MESLESLEQRLEGVEQRNQEYAQGLIDGWRKSYEDKGLAVEEVAICSIREMDEDYAYILMHKINDREISEPSEIPIDMVRGSDMPDAGVGNVFYLFGCVNRATNERTVGLHFWQPRRLSEDESAAIKAHASQVYSEISRHL